MPGPEGGARPDGGAVDDTPPGAVGSCQNECHPCPPNPEGPACIGWGWIGQAATPGCEFTWGWGTPVKADHTPGWPAGG